MNHLHIHYEYPIKMNNFQAAIHAAREDIRVTEMALVLSAQHLHNHFIDDYDMAQAKCAELKKHCNWLRRQAQKKKEHHYHSYTTIVQNLNKMILYIRTMKAICDHIGETLNEFSRMFCFTTDGAITRSDDALRLILIIERDFKEFTRLHKNATQLKEIADVVFRHMNQYVVEFVVSDPVA